MLRVALVHDFKAFPELSNSQLQVFQLFSPHKQITEDFDAYVVKVHDGDTISLSVDFRDFDFPLRLLDIDAPELSEGGDVARDYLESRALGQYVHVVINPKNRVGKYGRLLGRVMLTGLDLGSEMINLGLVKRFGSKKEGEVPSLLKVFSLKQWF